MTRATRWILIGATATALAACSNGTPAASPSAAAAISETPALPGSAAPVTGPYAPSIDPAAFGTTVDNPFFPLPPGVRWQYRSATKDGVETTIVTVTSRTRTIAGVECVEVRDMVRLDGALKEDTLDWYAQDRTGTVWYFGEDTKEYEHGKISSTEGSWVAGERGAEPGVLMPGHPRVGDLYRQEYYRGHAEDQAEVLSLAEQTRVPAGSYDGVVMTKETTPLEPAVLEHKYYARGIGLVLTVDASAGGARDELVAR
jgi:hypothetical protein